ncbi:predicted protein [Pyrenophora tritici-repentis Pt-1C-BFP]|uniref:Uncharacterized protein n=1 Tax=Pyrenophora tritici-repentis (strain Pt-1C-BFP) TaxID=426418 RepID=B2VX05_PYRTR|nr:uncharacterized protein PTRG_00242 [Pyrenophora tritici-repentis Pt-1C-BFP]EDU39680.1 predicted protein [Pyrenophora tritici-repentis Pt-1C-BFP]
MALHGRFGTRRLAGRFSGHGYGERCEGLDGTIAPGRVDMASISQASRHALALLLYTNTKA